MVFYNNSWYSKGFCHLKHEVRTFAVHRIKAAELQKSDFVPDEKIIRSVNVDDFLGFEKITGVKLKITGNLRDAITSHPLHTKQIIHDDNTVEIPKVSKEILFPFLLSLQGQATILEPEYLRGELKNLLHSMAQAY